MKNILTLQYVAPRSPVKNLGILKLMQEEPDKNALSEEEAAEIISKLHDGYVPDYESNISLDDQHRFFLQEKFSKKEYIKEFIKLLKGDCEAKKGDAIKKELYVIWSNVEIAESYKLICTTGILSNRRQQQSRLRVKISVSNAEYVDLGYYVLYFYRLAWIAAPQGFDTPLLDWDGNGRLSFGGAVTGEIYAEFEAVYDVWDISLPGVHVGDYRDYTALVIALWPGPPESLELDVPKKETIDLDCPDLAYEFVDDQKCAQKIKTEIKNPCTGYLVDSKSESYPAECVDGANPADKKIVYYIGLGDPRLGNACNDCTAEKYEELCCHPPAAGCVPSCLSYRRANQGGLMPHGGYKAIKAQYGDDAIIEWVYPDDGYCGEHVDRLSVSSCDKCKDIEKLQWDSGNPDIIAPNGVVDIVVSGGKSAELPIIWKISSGQGYSFSGGLQEISNGNVVRLYASAIICGDAKITANDGCSSAEGTVRPSNRITLDKSSVSLLPGQTVTVYRASGGTKPWTWAAEGAVQITGGGLTNGDWAYAHLPLGACDGGAIKITDNCWTSDTCTVVNARQPIVLDKDSVSLLPGQTVTVYRASGGTQPWTWAAEGAVQITGGGLTNGDWAYAHLPLGACDGGAVTITDNCGTSDTCTIVNARQPIVLDKDSVSLLPGQTVTVYRASGGTKPWTWAAEGAVQITGGGLTNGDWAYAHLPLGACDGGAIKITDNCWTSDTCTVVNARQPIVLDKDSVSLLPGQTVTVYRASGGTQPWTWAAEGAVQITGGGLTNGDWAYAHLPLGACDGGAVTITDNCGTSDTCTIVNARVPITLDRHSIAAVPGEIYQINCANGQSPWTWAVQGDVNISQGGEPNQTFIQIFVPSWAQNGGMVIITDNCGDQDICMVSV